MDVVVDEVMIPFIVVFVNNFDEKERVVVVGC